MAIIGKLLKNRRAGEQGVAWYLPNLATDATFEITSPDFTHASPLPKVHASKRIGGRDASPALAWNAPDGTAQLLLVVEDPDAPMGSPFVHCVALLEPTLAELPQDGLRADDPAPGVSILRSGFGRGYQGPAPIKGHGSHRYAFQLFALTEPIDTIGGKPAAKAKPREVFSAAKAVARGRIDGLYERP
ncbi:YbhB/YbcL family Raf kinase inhibitor-like protein [Nocardia vinacea]|uniref:YbhB/YbcL family Raf kinase inhibitor-like protein n=1 Tax=Nocardia vinacea TaxID=96468 RepID=A0ABZ1Z023_9NOCA|nr:YbhB/YbcL family Raf kinase inhibitor-like protein [Nocardia vinacea]